MSEEKIRLLRPGRTNLSRGASYLVLTCCSTRITTGPNTYRLSKADSGRWEVECEECGACASLSEVMSLQEEP